MDSAIIRKTKSVCPVCLEMLDTSLLESDGKVYMVKTCLRHGTFQILLSQNSKYYKGLDQFYFAVMRGKRRVLEYEIWPTQNCNMNCPICSLGDKDGVRAEKDPSPAEIEGAVKDSKAGFFTLSGGEPTCRSDLSEIIKILRKHKKTVTINTNGLRLADGNYLQDLLRSGLGRVNFQFDGFKRDTYLTLRGMDILDVKLKALENLRMFQIPVVLNVTVSKNLNAESLSEIIDYVAKNSIIKGITFFTISNIGGARKWSLDNYIVPDEVVDLLEQQTNSAIQSRNVYLFQKLHWALKSFLAQKACLYGRVYVLVRDRDGYKPIDKFINLERLESILDQYKNLYPRNPVIAKLIVACRLPIALLLNTSPVILKDFIVTAASYFFKTGNYLNAGRYIYISIATACDPFKIDYSMVSNCQNEIICTDRQTGQFCHQGSICLYGMGLEKPLYE